MKRSFAFTKFLLPRSLSKVARAGMCLLAAAVLGAGAASEASACGVPTSLPGESGSAFMGSGDYRFRLSDVWGTIALGNGKENRKETMEFGALFSPIENLYRSRYLGVHWSLPIFEATFLQISDRAYLMSFPTGHSETLQKTKIVNQLKGRNWLATIQGNTVTAKSSCGWTLTYVAGRLKTLKTPSGAQMEFHHNTQGASWVTVNGKSVLTLKPDYDAATQKIYHLNVQGGRHAILRFGTRPVMVKTAEKDFYGRPKEKKQEVLTFRSVQWDGEPTERNYSFGLNEMNVAGQLYKWDSGTHRLVKRGEDSFNFVKIQGVDCLKITRNGKITSILGYDIRTGRMVSQSGNMPLTMTESFTQNNMRLKPKRIWQIDNGGNKKLVQQYWYDETGNASQLLSNCNNKSILFKKRPLLESATDANTNKLLWKKEYDNQKRLIRVISGEKIYNFYYLSDNKNVKMKRVFNGDSIEIIFPIEKLNTFFQHLT